MTRPLFTLTSAASLVLCVAAVVVWLQSYGYWDEVRLGRFQRDAVSYTALSYDGQLRLARFHNDGGGPGPRAWGWNGGAYPPGWQSPPDTMRWDWGGSRLGFTTGGLSYTFNGPQNFSGSALVVGVPPWFACAAFAVLPLAWLASRRRSGPRPPAPGHCHRCGYDLRASTGRCPECGQPIAEPSP